MDNEISDPIITPFVQGKMTEGYEVVKKSGCDLLSNCPKCRKGYFYTFTNGGEILKQCPDCKYKEIINK